MIAYSHACVLRAVRFECRASFQGTGLHVSNHGTKPAALGAAPALIGSGIVDPCRGRLSVRAIDCTLGVS
jgi:hypothetical protein